MRKAPSADTYKLLYTRSGNECAFPKCSHPIFNDDGLYVAELCHIKSANKGGARFDESQTDEQRRAPENLMFMCHRHHKETDDVIKYPEEKLNEIKLNHESQFTEAGKQLSNEMIRQIDAESRFYWTRQKEKEYEFDELKMKTNFDFSESELYNEIIEGIDLINNYCETCSNSDSSEILERDLKDLFSKAGLDYRKIERVPYYENPFALRNWEYHNIGLPNLFSNLRMKLFQLRVRTFETLTQLNPENKELKSELARYRKEFDEMYENLYHVD
ncbi:MAG: hypothetical protein ABJN36_05120 [Cyclobacteriaceae bacterium]